MTAGAELDDLRTLGGDLMMVADEVAGRAVRPDLRRPVLEEPQVLRIRVDLDESEPAIWRTLDLRSDLTLDVVHQILQIAFGWTDSHLHRFALGGHPFAPTSQLFLCPFDVEEGEDDGIPASDVRLDEVLQEPGDALQYLYDYGDSWELTLRVEEVRPFTDDSRPAAAVAGERAAPPEDSGGGTDLETLSTVLEDPSRFDLAEVDEALRSPYFLLSTDALHPGVAPLLHRLLGTEHGRAFATRLAAVVSGPTVLTAGETAEALRAHRWFLDRAADDGIALTGAGYLKPADVEAAAAVAPAVQDWPGKPNRELHVRPLLEFRETVQSMGLLRKRAGVLHLTKAGAAAQQDPTRLWDHLATRLVPGKGDFDTTATLLLLVYVGSSPDGQVPLNEVATLLTVLGWQLGSGGPVLGHHLHGLRATDVLLNVGDAVPIRFGELRVSPAAATLARAALRSQD